MIFDLVLRDLHGGSDRRVFSGDARQMLHALEAFGDGNAKDANKVRGGIDEGYELVVMDASVFGERREVTVGELRLRVGEINECPPDCPVCESSTTEWDVSGNTLVLFCPECSKTYVDF